MDVWVYSKYADVVGICWVLNLEQVFEGLISL